jgi:hypothetical protein
MVAGEALRVLFCAHPLERATPEPAYDAEVAATRTLGTDHALVRIEPLIERGEPLASGVVYSD